ncbi:hypothetical protein A7K91_10605 [Paenibacillus oryzae]|uniref:Tryptophan-rich sensory protein n=1 Tax=Paenibacillus oryzae TaxID=1844972 RepID=A0A1A5YIR1_9BACL|nr:tryptophan-rich sensory protein [Paenibacillus oryzae]OBR65496.1 hypothetical protein A7K91_10605 [Paenibacillus oryzae]
MTKPNPYRWLNLLFYVGVLAVNALSVALPLGGITTKELSDRYYTLLTPAGYAFSIWSVIYLLLGGFIVYQFGRTAAGSSWSRAIGLPFIISCVGNMAWLLLWHFQQIELSLAAMLLLLVSLIFIYSTVMHILSPTVGERWLVRLPFSIYLGWISVATIVNVSIVLKKNNWSGWGLTEASWAVIMLCVGTLLAVLASYRYRNVWYPLVFVWAYVAIGIEHKETAPVYYSALALAALLLLYCLYLLLIAQLPAGRKRR